MSPRVPLLQTRHHLCLFLLMPLLLSRTAVAVPVQPGETVPLPGTNVIERPELNGKVVVSDIVPFVGPDNSYEGTVEVSVIQPPEDLHYWPVECYRILSFSASESGFEIIGLDSSVQYFIGTSLDVDFFNDTPGDRAPSTASLLFEFEGRLRFEFTNPVLPQETSHTMFLFSWSDIVIPVLYETGAGVIVRDPFGTVTKASFPAFPIIIPEPATGTLLGTTLLCTIWGCRCRHRSVRV